MKAVALLACCAAVLAVVFSRAAASDPLTGDITLTGITQEHHVFTGTMRFPDRESWYFSLASPRRAGKSFGYGIMACAFASVHSTVRQCNGSFSLPRGKIVVAGSFLYATFYELALTGGTELYSGAGGNLVARRVPGLPSKYTFLFHLR